MNAVNAERATAPISVVIPLHNKAAHVRRALLSVFSQKTKPSEVIVVDDASTDGGLDIVHEFAGVKVLRRSLPGPGGYAARNLAIREASNEFIAFLDADDEWNSDHITQLMNIIASAGDDSVLFATAYLERHPGGRNVVDVYSRNKNPDSIVKFDFKEFLDCWLDIGECPVWTSAIAVRRSTAIQVGLFPEERCRRGGDKDLWLRLAGSGFVIINSVSTAIYYKDSENMVTAIPHANTCHCIIDSLAPLSAGRDRGTQRRLMKLGNHETYLYALRTAKSTKVQRSLILSFDPSLDPLRYAVLLLLSSPIGTPLARAAQWFQRHRGKVSI